MNDYCKIIPKEIVNIIIDYIDYEKYTKIKSKKIMIDVLNDLIQSSTIFDCNNNNLPPYYIWLCWGSGVKNLNINDF